MEDGCSTLLGKYHQVLFNLMEGNGPWHCAGNQRKEVKSQEESSNKSEAWKIFKEMISRGGKLLTAEGQLSLLLLSENDGSGGFFGLNGWVEDHHSRHLLD